MNGNGAFFHILIRSCLDCILRRFLLAEKAHVELTTLQGTKENWAEGNTREQKKKDHRPIFGVLWRHTYSRGGKKGQEQIGAFALH
jgi:hypothetical protein